MGTIGLWLADQAAEVRGMDVIPESIEDAKKNAKRHGFTNTKYVPGKAEEVLPKWVKKGWKPDVIIVDPPRTGLTDNNPNILQTDQKNLFIFHVTRPLWQKIFKC